MQSQCRKDETQIVMMPRMLLVQTQAMATELMQRARALPSTPPLSLHHLDDVERY